MPNFETYEESVEAQTFVRCPHHVHMTSSQRTVKQLMIKRFAVRGQGITSFVVSRGLLISELKLTAYTASFARSTQDEHAAGILSDSLCAVMTISEISYRLYCKPASHQPARDHRGSREHYLRPSKLAAARHGTTGRQVASANGSALSSPTSDVKNRSIITLNEAGPASLGLWKNHPPFPDPWLSSNTISPWWYRSF